MWFDWSQMTNLIIYYDVQATRPLGEGNLRMTKCQLNNSETCSKLTTGPTDTSILFRIVFGIRNHRNNITAFLDRMECSIYVHSIITIVYHKISVSLYIIHSVRIMLFFIAMIIFLIYDILYF